MSEPVLRLVELRKHFPVRRGLGVGRQVVRAVDGVSLEIGRGEVLALVGESGSGKSTIARCIVRILEPTGGRVLLEGVDVAHLSRRALRPLRRRVGMVFQDPYSSLDPRMTCGRIVAEPLRLHEAVPGADAEARVGELFGRVGLSAELRHRYPHELSGGQRQRVGLARALSLEPRLLIADEPVSALDVSVQASILNLLVDLQREQGFSMLFITHNLGVVEFIADRVAVLHLGKIVEQASRRELFGAPRHPYTQALLSAAPVPDPTRQQRRRRVVLTGELPSPIDPPPGCAFHTRCPVAEDRCRREVPALLGEGGDGRLVACHLVAEGRPPDVAAAVR
jgi:oligopeptide transport system ATP-binding protein